MDTTFYEDNFHSPENIRMLKRSMTLDLNSVVSSNKQTVGLLTSPDVNMLKIATPELERLIIAQSGLVTTTPTPTDAHYFNKSVTEEQEMYARGFVDALAQLHHPPSDLNGGMNMSHGSPGDMSQVNVMQGVSNGTCSVLPCHPSQHGPQVSLPQHGQIVYPMQQQQHVPSNVVCQVNNMPPVTSVIPVTSSVNYHHTMNNGYIHGLVKEEPQIVPSVVISPPLSPIDMEDQERIKLERKRLRNRIAASKCRRRKLERITRLETKVKMLKGENCNLVSVASKLREQVCSLKQEVMNHARWGCQIMVSQAY